MIPYQIAELPSCVIKVMPQSVQISIGVVFLLFVFGCQTPLTVKQMQAKNPFAKNAPKTPVKMVDAWNSFAQAVPDGKVMRGMAGRVHFYDSRNGDRAIKVDGEVTVYVFDGNETDPAYAKPLKVFQFQAETLDKHYSYQEPVGHGYNFFLPMDEIGGVERPLSIIVRFDNRLDEMFVMTQPTSTILAGRRPQQPAEPAKQNFWEFQPLLAEANRSITTAQNVSAIQQVGYIEEKTETEPVSSRIATTIPLTNGMTRRLHAAPNLNQEIP